MNIIAKAESGRALVEIKGSISGWKDTEANFTSKINDLINSGVKDVHIYINSPGGECMEANEIVNVINKFPGKITGEGGAIVASAATYIAIACSSFTMPENGLFMVHQVSGGSYGKVSELEGYISLMKKLNDHYYAAFEAKAKDKKKLKEEWDKGDYWMSAKEAHEQGFVSEVTGKTTIDKTTAMAITNCGYKGEIIITDSINNQNQNQMDVSMMAGRLGMPVNSTEAQVIAKIDEYKRKSERVDMLEEAESKRREQEIEDLLNNAINEKRITADVKPDWKETLTSNFESGKKMLLAMKVVKTPEINKPANASTSGKKWEDYQDDPQALKELMDNTPEEYERLLTAYVNKNV